MCFQRVLYWFPLLFVAPAVPRTNAPTHTAVPHTMYVSHPGVQLFCAVNWLGHGVCVHIYVCVCVCFVCVVPLATLYCTSKRCIHPKTHRATYHILARGLMNAENPGRAIGRVQAFSFVAAFKVQVYDFFLARCLRTYIRRHIPVYTCFEPG